MTIVIKKEYELTLELKSFLKEVHDITLPENTVKVMAEHHSRRDQIQVYCEVSILNQTVSVKAKTIEIPRSKDGDVILSGFNFKRLPRYRNQENKRVLRPVKIA